MVSAYNLFVKEKSKQIRTIEPNIDFAEMSKRIAILWKSLSPYEKAHYEKLAADYNEIDKKREQRENAERKRIINKLVKEENIDRSCIKLASKSNSKSQKGTAVVYVEKPVYIEKEKPVYIERKSPEINWNVMFPPQKEDDCSCRI